MSKSAKGTGAVRGHGIREIDRQLMYSAAWLDDGRQALVPKPSESSGLPFKLGAGATSTSSMRTKKEHGHYGPGAAKVAALPAARLHMAS